ncbi:hypothetical protein HDU79_002483, partial [Rhizoclosmatium sp. JEL0117]
TITTPENALVSCLDCCHFRRCCSNRRDSSSQRLLALEGRYQEARSTEPCRRFRSLDLLRRTSHPK